MQQDGLQENQLRTSFLSSIFRFVRIHAPTQQPQQPQILEKTARKLQTVATQPATTHPVEVVGQQVHALGAGLARRSPCTAVAHVIAQRVEARGEKHLGMGK